MLTPCTSKQAPVSVKGDLEMIDNKTIDDVDVSVLEREVVDLTSDQFIDGDVVSNFFLYILPGSI